MTGTATRTALAGGVATVLGSLAFTPVFAVADWAPPVIGAVVVVVLGGIALRSGVPWLWRLAQPDSSLPDRWAAAAPSFVPLGQLLLAWAFLTWVFAADDATWGFVPTPTSLGDLAGVLQTGTEQLRSQATPALPLMGLVSLTTLAVTGVALAVDMVAVGARQPALGGIGLLVLYCVPVSTITGDVGLLPFLAPAAGFAVLLWADQHARLADRVRSGPGAPLGTGTLIALRTGALALVAGLVLPVLVPTLGEGSLAQRWGTGGQGGTGTRIDPFAELQGDLTMPDPRQLMSVDVSVDDPGYLRAVSLEQYGPEGWQLDDLDDSRSVDGAVQLAPLQTGAAQRPVRATITELEHDDRFLPVFDSPLSVDVEDGDDDWRFDEASSTVFGAGATSGGLSYRVTAAEPRPSEEDLARSRPLPPDDVLQQRYTRLPQLAPAVTDLVDQLTSGATDPFDAVRAVHGYLSDRANGFVYSLSTAPGTSGDDLVDFLENKRGYCEQYAGAMAVMVRAAGVPARVVLGYTPGAEQPDGSRLITTDDAHAWVEVWFQGIGWVPFDPTPIEVDRAVTLPWAPRADAPVDPVAAAPAVPTPTGPLPAVPSAELDREDELIPALDAQAQDDSGVVRAWLTGVGGTLLLLGVLAVPALARVGQRRRRLTDGSATALWDELMASVTDLGIDVHPTRTTRQTARQLAELVAGVEPPAVAAVRELALAEEGSSYGRPGGVTAGSPAALAMAQRGLQRATPTAGRVRALLWPASTLADLRTCAMDRLRRRPGRPSPA